MQLPSITFDPNGAPLRIGFQFYGDVAASYRFILWEAESNHYLIDVSGNNQNAADDAFDLPLPVSSNAGRLVELIVIVTGLEDGNYDIETVVSQDGIRYEPVVVSSFIKESATQTKQIYLRLNAS